MFLVSKLLFNSLVLQIHILFILGHPNVKLFITQGGLQSLQEAVYNYIPILGMPFFGDQHTNIAVVVVKGFGLSVDHNTLTKKHFKQTILEVIENSK